MFDKEVYLIVKIKSSDEKFATKSNILHAKPNEVDPIKVISLLQISVSIAFTCIINNSV